MLKTLKWCAAALLIFMLLVVTTAPLVRQSTNSVVAKAKQHILQQTLDKIERGDL